MKTRAFVSVVAVLVFLVISALGQVSTSRLEGTVQDESGAVIPAAKVDVVNVKTQGRAEATADAQGRFIFPSLAPGEYTLTVEAAGFRKAVRNSVILAVGVTVAELVKMEVGPVTESVQVEANAVRVQTTDSQIGSSVALRDIDVLPQLGRGPIALAIYSAGVQIDPTDSSFSRINGTRQGSNNATLDGVEVNDPVAPRLGLAMTPNTTDTVEEFRVVTNGGKAEYGRNAGGQVQMITRSGSNEFHGGMWDYLRNTNLNANTFFSNQTGQTRPKFIQNQFGARGEGRIIKDRTFFFGNYEGKRTRQEIVRNRTVLTPDLKSGIFRWKANGNGAIQSYDIFKNDPRGKGMDPLVKKNSVGLLPDPNNNDVGDGLNTAGYRFNNPNNSYSDQYTFKIDHNLTSANRVFFRWSWMRTYSMDSLNGADSPFPGNPMGMQGGHRMGWAAGSDWTLTNTMVNELRVGGQKTNSDFLRPGRLHEMMFVSNTYTDPIGSPTGFGQGRTVPIIEITDNLSKIYGAHTLKAGVQLRFITQDGWREDYIWPTVYLSVSNGNTVPANIGPSGNIISADRQRFENHYNELLGRMSYVFGRFYSDLTKFLPAGTARTRRHINHEYGFFLQDDWKVSPRLTLNLGLRYEFTGVPYEANGLQGTLTNASQINFANNLTNLAVQKGGMYFNNDWNNFAPRFGFSFDPTGAGKTAIRGAWGMFYDRMINAVMSPVDLNTPGFNQDVRDYVNQDSGDRRLSDGVRPLAQPSTPQLSIPVNRQAAGTVMVPNLRTGYVMQFSFNVQRELFRNAVMEAGYVGTRGVKLFFQSQMNQFKINDGFLDAFNELAAKGAGTPASNVLVKMFGTAQSAISAIGAATLAQGAVGSAANTIDTNYYARYANAGLSDTWLRNFPQFNTMYLGTNDGRSQYDSLQLNFRRQHGALKFNANYTFSKSIDNWANEGNGTSGGSVMDYRHVRLNRGISDFDKTHSFNSSLMYTLPVGQNRRFLGSAPRIVDSLIGGWEVGLLNMWQSGSVFSVTSGRATGANSAASTWADYTGDRTIGSLDRRGNGVYYFTDAQKAAFTFPVAGSVGSSGRNTFRGPRFFNVDASLLKRFKVAEGKAFTFRAEAYNLFNNVNFGLPGASILTPASFGKINSTIGPNGSGGARMMQMALRFDF